MKTSVLTSLSKLLQKHSKILLLAAVAALALNYYPNVPFNQAQVTPALIVYVLIGAYALVVSCKDLNTYVRVILAYLILNWFLFEPSMHGALLAGLFIPSLLLTQVKIPRNVYATLLRLLPKVGVLLSMLAVGQLFLSALGARAGLNAAYDETVFGFARPRLFTEEPQFLAAFLLLCLSASLVYTHRLRWSSSYVLLCGILITMSRGAALAIVVGFGAYVLLSANKKKTILNLGVLSVVSLLSAVSLVSMAGYIHSDRSIEPVYFTQIYLNNMTGRRADTSKLNQGENRQTVLSSNENQSTQNQITTSAGSRADNIRDGLEIATSSPQQTLFGSGPEGVDKEFSEKYGETTPTGRDYVINNFYVHLLVTHGMLGLGMLIAGAALALQRLAVRRDDVAQFMFIGLVFLLVQQLFFSSMVNNLHFWLLLGVAVSYLIYGKRTLESRNK